MKNRWMRVRVGGFLLGGVALAAAAVAAENQRLTLNDLAAVDSIAESALSPDGKTVALSYAGQIMLLPSAGGWPVALTDAAGGKSGLSWSPDGRRIAFASQGSIWTVAAEGGQPRRLTHAAAGEGDPRQAGDRRPQWSPAGRWILFETGRRGRSSVNVVSDDGTTERFLTNSRADEMDAAWDPSGTHISYTERAPEYFSGKLRVIAFDKATAQAGDPVTLYTAPTDRGGSWSLNRASWSPDGHTLALTLQESGWNHIYLLDAGGGGKPRQLSEGKWEDSNPVFSPDGKSIVFVSNRKEAEQAQVLVMTASGKDAKPVARFEEPGMEAAPEWSPHGRSVYFHRTSPFDSPNLFVADVAGHGGVKRLTETLPKTYSGALQMPKRVTYKSKDGTEIAAMLYRPKTEKPGAGWPAVLWIHGGPEGEDVYRLDTWAQYLAQQGYVVLEPNYRGSTGYGEQFRNMNVEDSGGGELEDVVAGAHFLVEQGLADAKRLAIGGGSHGGTMVAYAVTHYPALFQAAIEMYGVVDRATFIQRTNRPSAIRWQMKMGGPPEAKPEAYARANSLAKVDQIQTPLLILHGENDPQVPPYESAQFVRALAEHKKVFYYFTYPGELHGFSQREHKLDAWRKELAFLQRYINPGFGESVTATDDLAGQGTVKSGRGESASALMEGR